MNTEKWQKINDLFNVAIDVELKEQLSFLKEKSEGDEEVFAEVWKLICSHENSKSFIQNPVVLEILSNENSETITTDSEIITLGNKTRRFEILKLIGKSGMGETFLARDEIQTELEKKLGKTYQKNIPIIEILLEKRIRLFIKREDLIHHEISGNKFWKLFYNVENYLSQNPNNHQTITFGGAFSNHIFAVSALGKELNLKTLGIIRGDELENNWRENPTLFKANQNGMEFRFVSRADYRNKEKLTENLQNEFPEALIIPEGGTNKFAVEGIKFMLNDETKRFDYLCCAVGTGGTVAGISKFAEDNQKVLGFKVVKDDSLDKKIFELSGRKNFELIDASENGYGKFSDETVQFINDFHIKYKIPLEPIYTGKMLRKLFELIEADFFPKDAKILVFHTGGLQGIWGANEKLRKQGKDLIKFPVN